MADDDSGTSLGGVNVTVVADLAGYRSALTDAQRLATSFDQSATASMANVAKASQAMAAVGIKASADLTAAQRALVAEYNATGAMSAKAIQAAGGYAAAEAVIAKALKEQATASAAAAAETATLAAVQNEAAASSAALAVSATAASAAVTQTGISSSLAVRELVVMGREIARGNFSRLAGSATLLAQAFGFLRFLMTPVGAGLTAIVAATLGAAAAAAFYENTLKKLSDTAIGLGRASGLTGTQLMRAAQQASDASNQSIFATTKETAALAAAGVRSQEEIAGLSVAIQQYADITGEKVPAATKAVAEAMKDPVKGAKDLNDALGFLDAAETQQIQRLVQMGDKDQAVTLLGEKFRQNMQDSAGSATALGGALDTLAKAAGNVGRAYQALNDTLMIFSGLASAADIAAGRYAADAVAQVQGAARTVNQASVAAMQPVTPEEMEEARYDKLKGDLAVKLRGAAVEAGKGNVEQFNRDERAAQALSDTIGRLTDAKGKYITQSEREHEIVRAQIDETNAVKAHNVALKEAAAQKIAYLKAGDTIETNVEARQHAADEAAKAGSQGAGRPKKDTFHTGEETREVQTAGELALAQAYLTSGAAALKAEATRTALTDATRAGRTEAQKAAQVQSELNLEVAKTAAEQAKKVADLNAQASARTVANVAIASGSMSKTDAERAMKEELEFRPLIAAAALAEGAAKTELLKVIQALKAAEEAEAKADSTSKAAEDLAKQKDEIDLIRLKISLINASKVAQEQAEAKFKETQALRESGGETAVQSPEGQRAISGAAQIGALQGQLSSAEAMKQLTGEVDKETASLRAQRQAYGLSFQAEETYVEMQKLLSEAKEKGIELTQQNIAVLKQEAVAYGQATEALRQMKESEKAALDASQALSDMFEQGIEGMIYDGKKLNETMRDISQQIGKDVLRATLTGQGPFAGILGTANPSTPGGANGGVLSQLFGAGTGAPGASVAGAFGRRPTGAPGDPISVTMDGTGPGGAPVIGSPGVQQGGLVGWMRGLFGGNTYSPGSTNTVSGLAGISGQYTDALTASLGGGASSPAAAGSSVSSIAGMSGAYTDQLTAALGQGGGVSSGASGGVAGGMGGAIGSTGGAISSIVSTVAGLTSNASGIMPGSAGSLAGGNTATGAVTAFTTSVQQATLALQKMAQSASGGGGNSSAGGLLGKLLGGGGGGAGAAAGGDSVDSLVSDAGSFTDELAAVMHTGSSYVGTPARMLSVTPQLFINAPRLHSGLAPDEFPAILQRGEQVIPRGGQAVAGLRDVHVHVKSPDHAGFGRTQGQIARETRRQMSRVR